MSAVDTERDDSTKAFRHYMVEFWKLESHRHLAKIMKKSAQTDTKNYGKFCFSLYILYMESRTLRRHFAPLINDLRSAYAADGSSPRSIIDNSRNIANELYLTE